MDERDHYAYLGVDPSVDSRAIAAAVERYSKRANALANTQPSLSQDIRERLRRIKADLLTSPEHRAAYDRSLRGRETVAYPGPLVHPQTPAPPESTLPLTFEVPQYQYNPWPPGGSGPLPPGHEDSLSRGPLLASGALLICLLGGGLGFAIAGHHSSLGQVSSPLPTATSRPVPTAASIPEPTGVPTSPPPPPISVAINSVSVDNSRPSTGSLLTLTYVVDNVGAQPVSAMLGATVYSEAAAGQSIDDPTDDVAVSLLPGTHSYTRQFAIPNNASSGAYDVLASVASPNWKRNYSLHRYNGMFSVDNPQSDAVLAALDQYHQAWAAAFGPNYDTSNVGNTMTGTAYDAVMCSVQGGPNSLSHTQSYYTYQMVSKSDGPTTINGDTATVVETQHKIITFHSPSSPRQTDTTVAVTYTLTNDGSGWKVSNYRYDLGGTPYSAIQDAAPCQ